MKKMMKKWLLPLFGLLTAITLFAGCNAKDVLSTAEDIIDIVLEETPTPTPAPTATQKPTATPTPEPTPTPKPVWGWANAKGTIKTTYDSATNGSNIPIEIPNMPVSGETCNGELTGYGKSTDATEDAVWEYLDNKFGEDFCGVGHLKVVDGSVHW